MKLEISHLAPYLPYGLKFEHVEYDYSDKVNHNITKMESLSADCITFDDCSDYYFDADNCDRYNPTVVPLLLPMSSLYTEITHNGKTFIPQKELDWGSWNDEIGYIVSAEYGENPRVAINVLDFIDDYYKLLEWHFDVFGLIDKGLAIDKTKIK